MIQHKFRVVELEPMKSLLKKSMEKINGLVRPALFGGTLTKIAGQSVQLLEVVEVSLVLLNPIVQMKLDPIGCTLMVLAKKLQEMMFK